ncbi:MAG: DUF2489 domain-containing protein [Porticoccus sp.]
MTMNLLMVFAVLIVVFLGGYALYLYLKLRTKKTEREQQKEVLAEELKGRHEHYRKSIHVIASAIVAEQVSLTEGAIRISMLVSQLEISESEKADYQVFFQLTEATSHIPILDEWKKLNTLQKRGYDQEREALEETFQEFIENAARKILGSSESADSQPLFYSVGEDQEKD